MRIAIDISPLSSGHSVRGVGFYLKNLLDALKNYHPENEYIEFTKSSEIPKDVGVVHYPYFDPFSLTLPILTNQKIIVTVHDLTPLVLPLLFPIGIKGKLFWQLQKYLLKKTKIILTDSMSSKSDIEKLVMVKKAQVEVVYLAAARHFRVITDKNVLQKVKAKYHLPSIFSLYVGDVTPNKNLPNLVKASLRTNTSLVMVGKALADNSIDTSHPWTKDLGIVRKLAIANPEKITLIGFIPDEDLVAMYNLASVFVMPSLYEGFGLPVLEAFACGCPVITSAKSSLKEIAGNAAQIVDPENVEEIALAIEKIIGDKKFAKNLSAKGLMQAEKFSWKKTADETVRAYARSVKE